GAAGPLTTSWRFTPRVGGQTRPRPGPTSGRPSRALPTAGRARCIVMLDDVCPPSVASWPVAPLTPRRGRALALAVASVFSVGAARTREAPVHNAARDAADRVVSNLGVSACTSAVLSRHGLLLAARVDPEGAAMRLEAALASRPVGEPGGLLAL